MGSGKIIEIAFLVMSREADAASTPEYQALITVRRRPKARIATVMPRMVRPLRSLLWKAFLKRILRSIMVHEALVQMPYNLCPLRRPGIMGDHDDGLAHIVVQTLHHREDLPGRRPVQ